MLRAPWLGALALATSGGLSVLADYSSVEIYSDANCDSVPLVVTLELTNETCTPTDSCSAIEISNSSYYYAERCATDRFEYTSQLFSGAKYLMIDGFQEQDCQSYVRSNIFLAAGTCQLASYVGARSEIATLFNDGSAYMTIYNDSACATKAQTFDLNASVIQEHSCYLGYNKFYTSDHTGILSGSNSSSASASGSNSTATATSSHDSKMSAGALFGIVVACLAIVILPALLIYWKLRRNKRKEKRDSRGRAPDVALAVSDKHYNEERYAPEMSPRSDQRSTLSSHTGGSTPALRSNELRCDPLRSDELRSVPFNSDRHDKRSRKPRSEELRTGGRLRSERLPRGDSIGRSGRLHTDELRTTPVRGNKLHREDLSNNTIHSDPVRSDRLKNERLRKERQRRDRPRGDEPCSVRSDRQRGDRMPSDPVRSDRMRSMELRSNRAPSDPVRSDRANERPPVHAERLRGPVTADSVCKDNAILSSRIPRDDVFVEDLIGRGGYGEVYKGTYEGRAVAVKMLFPETRKSTRHVTEFLTEVKMMTVMDHPRVVEFVGVSWNNLMDLCVVTEFMAGGDLRAWLSDCADNNSPVGFDYTKVKIATHVAHALAYLHSLTPSVIHRDLKSRNILLSESQDAKLADFGASRERVDRTMTAGVGTSLWIAPEVMMGERYDDKADMFSFGIVLSELDSQQNPYAHAKENNPAGRKMPETAILQLVAMGKLRVEFSPGALKGVVQIGTACTSIDPTERPSAAEAFRKLQTILAQEAKRAVNAK
ncbi:hypothetical protein PHYSODRAFT_337522 [Phytophthora sojae]|uniref:Protein kinase domain-containing protein n=1 Tax=Phytophthora sojae (strain P6497) TaxID=1094619 RepID=G5A1E7_PHYSP|nr:hypothetical protein PHYSODRAFT_337522 [Phytophthora sojae]EGZ10746.1 hypothetical protein PHYSODRAFT_337522 [Phytophthora sojae]|eukprot:XP_009533491.1 hypothetical protein PHYSODRAFT_337522 [Phytophthora sojae]